MRIKKSLYFILSHSFWMLLHAIPFLFLKKRLYLLLRNKKGQGILYTKMYYKLLHYIVIGNSSDYLVDNKNFRIGDKTIGKGQGTVFHSAEENRKYLVYFPLWPIVGLDHAFENLHTLLLEAYFLNRVPVIDQPPLWFFHNFMIARDYEWNEYIDLSRMQVQEGAAGNSGHSLEYISHDKFLSLPFSKEDIHVLPPTLDGVQEQYEKYPVLYRRPLIDHHYWKKSFPSYFLAKEKYNIIIPYSHRARVLAGRIVERIGAPFAAAHVRRSDRNLDEQDIPYRPGKKFSQIAQPRNILCALQKSLPIDIPVYIMSDEKHPGFFNLLRGRYKIYQFFDFPELEELISADRGKGRDNYFLYTVEKLIFLAAQYRFHTYTIHRFDTEQYGMQVNYVSVGEGDYSL